MLQIKFKQHCCYFYQVYYIKYIHNTDVKGNKLKLHFTFMKFKMECLNWFLTFCIFECCAMLFLETVLMSAN